MVRKSEGLWEALGLVDHNRTGVRVEEAFKIGSQLGEVGRPFKIKAGPVWERVACKSAFSALPRSHKEHGGKRPKKGSEDAQHAAWGRIEYVGFLYRRFKIARYCLTDGSLTPFGHEAISASGRGAEPGLLSPSTRSGVSPVERLTTKPVRLGSRRSRSAELTTKPFG